MRNEEQIELFLYRFGPAIVHALGYVVVDYWPLILLRAQFQENALRPCQDKKISLRRAPNIEGCNCFGRIYCGWLVPRALSAVVYCVNDGT